MKNKRQQAGFVIIEVEKMLNFDEKVFNGFRSAFILCVYNIVKKYIIEGLTLTRVPLPFIPMI